MTSETVEVLGTGIEAISPGALWNPTWGDETSRFIAGLRPETRESVRSEGLEILQRCVQPGTEGRRAGLIVGYVQSGKTTSFTAVTALAADNGYGMVIIIGGTSNPLLEQTRGRLARDLALDEPDAYRRWISVHSPQVNSTEAERLAAGLEAQLDPDADDDERVPVIITVMKQHAHLDNLAQVLEQLDPSIELNRITTLIVDDEADQATPNIRRNGAESTTYSRLRRIRAALPSHALLQYTATPQAPLLVSIADEISPEFVCTLRPGEGYTGGQFFFVQGHNDYVKHIDATDLALIDAGGDSPPPSLLAAYAVYLLGCAVAKADGERFPSQRSMLVHPSRQTLPQAQFLLWLRQAKEHWINTLSLPETDDDRADLVQAVFEPAWTFLQRTLDTPHNLTDILPKVVRVLKKVILEEVNAAGGRAPEIKWAKGPYWVLVGGQLLDRGFTVEGLTVTYMPRSIGVGNADTVQQRARFFGYKDAYARYCRMYLDPTVDAAFTNYVKHEEALRKQLRKVAESGESLKDWKRVFLLDRALRPTRQAVMRLRMVNVGNDEWFPQRDFAERDAELLQDNREVVNGFLGKLSFQDYDERSGPELNQQHTVASVSLRKALEGLLANYVMFGDDAPRFTGLRLALEEAADESDLTCQVVQMSPGLASTGRRRRSLNDSGLIKNLFQGKNPKSGKVLYPGDRMVREDDIVTIQVHRIDLTLDDGTDVGRDVCAEDIPVLAIYIPTDMQERVLVQRD